MFSPAKTIVGLSCFFLSASNELDIASNTALAPRYNEAYMASIGEKWYVLFFYVLNFIMVGIDIVMYARNRQLDKKRANGEEV